MKIDEKALLELKLVHYFITKENFVPVIIHGIEDEIWLENKHSDYRIIRIVTKKIFNEEQYNFDIDKTKDIAGQIKRKTFNPFMSMLTIYLNIDEDIKDIISSKRNYTNIVLDDEKDLEDNEIFKKYYKGIKKDLNYKEEGFELVTKITSDIAKKNIEENERFNNMYKQKKPIITGILLGINIFIFVILFMIANFNEDEYLSLINVGANIPELIREGQYYRIISSGFLHVGMIHILCNMYSLFVLGPNIEHFYGKAKYLLIYLFSMIMASLFVMVFERNSAAVGASGAIFGLLGSLLYFGYHYRGYLGNQVINQIIPVIIINLVIGFLFNGISNAAHIGGLLGGICVSFMLGMNDKDDKKNRITGAIITFILTGFMIYLAFFK